MIILKKCFIFSALSIILCETLFLTKSIFAESEDSIKSFIYDDHGRRDPLWPLVSSTGTILTYASELSLTDLKLEGIMLGGEGKNIAIINGRILKTNDTIGHFTVLQIDTETVVVAKGQVKFTLILKKGD